MNLLNTRNVRSSRVNLLSARNLRSGRVNLLSARNLRSGKVNFLGAGTSIIGFGESKLLTSIFKALG